MGTWVQVTLLLHISFKDHDRVHNIILHRESQVVQDVVQTWNVLSTVTRVTGRASSGTVKSIGITCDSDAANEGSGDLRMNLVPKNVGATKEKIVEVTS